MSAPKDARERAAKIILARRARFVAAAIAGVSVACSGGGLLAPNPCLDVADDSGTRERDADPQPCLGAPYDPDADRRPDADNDADADADAGDAEAGDADTDADL